MTRTGFTEWLVAVKATFNVDEFGRVTQSDDQPAPLLASLEREQKVADECGGGKNIRITCTKCKLELGDFDVVTNDGRVKEVKSSGGAAKAEKVQFMSYKKAVETTGLLGSGMTMKIAVPPAEDVGDAPGQSGLSRAGYRGTDVEYASTALSLTPVAGPWQEVLKRLSAYLLLQHPPHSAPAEDTVLIGVDVVQRKMVEVNSFGIEKPIPVERAGLEYWRQSTWELWFGPYSAFVSARLRAAKPDQTEVELWFPTRVHDAVYSNDPTARTSTRR